MLISPDDRVRMERAHVLAWPALHAANIDGWLWRSSGGGSQRANSVSTIDFNGASLEGAIVQVESCYDAVAQPARFHTFDETSPSGLVHLLQTRGYKPGEPTVTMFKGIEATSAARDVEVRDHAWAEWRSVYLGGITEDRRASNALILDRIPAPSAFFGCRRGRQIVATALCVVSHGCAVIECVATRPDARRQGAAQLALAALEGWAAQYSVNWIGLQVAAGNSAAVALYRRLGFVAGATNSFWVR
jgi:GNAT superfamily N-acetyltransferase